MSELCPPFAPFFGFAGASSAMIFCALGACYGTAKAGLAISGLGSVRPQLIMKGLIPVVMAGIVGIYGLVVAVLIVGSITVDKTYSLYTGSLHLGAGLAVGFAGLTGGWAIGVSGEGMLRGYCKEPKMFVGMVVVLIFAEVLGLYGMIVALVLNAKVNNIC